MEGRTPRGGAGPGLGGGAAVSVFVDGMFLCDCLVSAVGRSAAHVCVGGVRVCAWGCLAPPLVAWAVGRAVGVGEF